MRLALEDEVRSAARGGTPLILPDTPRVDLAQRSAASAALAEYRMVSNGAATYERLGYDTGNGAAETKLLEYIVIDGLISAEQRRQRGKN